MATYGYEIIDKEGKIKKGSIDAESMDKAKADLKGQGMTVISLTEQSMLTKDIEIDIGGKPTNRDLSVFCRQFVSMTKAGVTIVEAMRMLCEQTENKKLQKALDDVRVNMEKGESLAGSLSKHPKVFPSIMVNMVAAGEASGSLEKSLDRVATQLERNSKTQALVKKAMMYPIMLLLIALAVIILMLTFVIPQYSDMFKDLGTGLPGITLAVMAASDFVKAWWYAIIAVVVVIVRGKKWKN